MNTHEFKIWLVTNGYTQKRLSEKLGVSQTTISTYCTNNRFPLLFQVALKGLEKEIQQ